MAQNERRKQLSRAEGLARRLVGAQMTEEEGKAILSARGLGEAKREVSRQGAFGGQVGRGRSLGGGGQLTQREQRRIGVKFGGGLGNRSLRRFRQP